MLIIVIGFNVPKFLSGITSEATKVTVLDNEDIFEGRLDNLHDQFLELGYEVEIDKTSTREQVQEKVKNGEVSSAIILTETDSRLYFEYLVDGMGLGTTVPTDVINAIQLTYQNMQLAKLGIPEDQLPTLNMESNISVTSLSSDESSSNIFVMMLLSIVLFYAIYFYAYQVSSAITVEKTSRIIETLVTSTSPRIIVLGKTIGIGLVGIAQTLLLILVAVICANVFLPARDGSDDI